MLKEAASLMAIYISNWQHHGRSVLFCFRSHLSVWIIDTNFCLHSSSHCIYVLARSKTFNAIPAMPFTLQLKPNLSSHWGLVWSFVRGFVCISFVLSHLSMHFLCFFGHFWAYVGQPHGHIGWAIPMPFPSMNFTNPKTAPWNFHKKILSIGDFEK